MNTENLLSVIVPAYNVAEWLPRCLDSICAQTYRNLEILIINDGSTDDTPQIIDRYAAHDKRIRAIHQFNKGLMETRDIGIREAKGSYVGFVDGDDEIIPEMYERLLKNAIQYEAAISQCGIMYCFYDGRQKPVHGTGRIKVYNRIEGCTALLQGTEMEPSLCNKIYRSDILKDSCLDQNIKNNEDMLRNIVLFNRADRSVLEDFCGYLYWRRRDSMSNNLKSVEIGTNIIQARKLILEYVPAELKNEALRNYISGTIITYNSLIGNHSAEAMNLRVECKRILKQVEMLKTGLPVSMRLNSLAIRFFPTVYEIVRKFHVRQRRKRIKKQAAQV